jgi:cysteine desulfurase
MTQRLAYLDWNATAPVRPEVRAAMAETLAGTGNPSSVHRFGREAKRLLEQARTRVARLVNASSSDIVFTSGGTEANHLALRGIPGRKIIVSAIEHDSVRWIAPDAVIVSARPDGVIALDALERALEAEPCPALVSLMLANNETGVVQPVAEAGRIAHAHGALFHCDAVQAAGKIAVDAALLGADLLSLSGHKIGGPMGVGALIVAPDLPLHPLQTGGGQERGRRAGTENLPGIVGFGVAANIAAEALADLRSIVALRDLAETRLLAISPDAHIHGVEAPRLPNTICITMPGVPAATQVMALDLSGVMVSAGAACSSGKVRRSHVLEAMGVPREEADGAIRISLGWSTTEEDIDQLVTAWGTLYARTRAKAA